MSKILIIAEKPNVSQKIVKALCHNPNHKEGYYEDDKYVVSNCLGHLMTLLMPKDIDEKYKCWDLNNLPFTFNKIPLQVKDDDGVKRQYNILKKLLQRTDISEVVNCCDAEREGELIFRNVYYTVNPYCKKSSRMWTESVASDDAIKEAFDNRRDSSEYNNLYLEALSRQYADYHIGLNATQGLTAKFGGHGVVLSSGRVQTPTLNIIVMLEKTIRDFKSMPFWKVIATVDDGKFEGTYIDADLDNNRFTDKKEAEAIVKKTGLGDAVVVESNITQRKEKPKKLYSLSDLQVDMGRRYGYGAQVVLDACQSLYETHGLTTYPRTSENRISVELASKIMTIVDGLPSMFKRQVSDIKTNKWKFAEFSIAKKDVGSHEALTPVPEKIADSKLDKLTEVERNVYKAIVERFLSNFYPDAIYRKQEIIFERNECQYKSSFETLISAGHHKAYSNYEEKESKDVIPVNKGDKVRVTAVNLQEGKTEPPSRFTEGSLIATMLDPSKYIQDKDDKKVLKDTKGLGTEATRAAIIEGLKARKYIKVEKGKIFATELGESLIDTIPVEIIKSIPLTVFFEKKLAEIREGTYTKQEFMVEVKKITVDIIDGIKNANDKKLNESALCKCPHCSSDILKGKYSFYCSNKECKVSISPNALERLGIKKLNDNTIKSLLENGKTTKKYKMISPKSGKSFEAQLVYSYDETAQYPNNIGFLIEDFNSKPKEEVIDENAKKICTCPYCNSPIVKTNVSYKCSNSTCHIKIPFDVYKGLGLKSITDTQAKELLTKGKTSKTVKLKSKAGKNYEAFLVFNPSPDVKYPSTIEFAKNK